MCRSTGWSRRGNNSRGQWPIPLKWRPIRNRQFRRWIEHRRVDIPDLGIVNHKPFAEDVSRGRSTWTPNEDRERQHHSRFFIYDGKTARRDQLHIEVGETCRATAQSGLSRLSRLSWRCLSTAALCTASACASTASIAHPRSVFHSIAPGIGHHDGLLMVYLPKEKILVEADAYNPAAQPNAPVPATPSPYNTALVANIERLKLDVNRIIPIHYPADNRVVTRAELMRMVGKTSSN